MKPIAKLRAAPGVVPGSGTATPAAPRPSGCCCFISSCQCGMPVIHPVSAGRGHCYVRYSQSGSKPVDLKLNRISPRSLAASRREMLTSRSEFGAGRSRSGVFHPERRLLKERPTRSGWRLRWRVSVRSGCGHAVPPLRAIWRLPRLKCHRSRRTSRTAGFTPRRLIMHCAQSRVTYAS